MCLDETYGGNATAYLSANPVQHLTGSPVCGECLDEFVHDIQNAHDGPLATMNQMLPPQQIPVLVGCLCEHSEELDTDERAAPRILFGCVMRVGSNVALPPASRQQAEAAALALFDRSEPTAEASPSEPTAEEHASWSDVAQLWGLVAALWGGLFLCIFFCCRKTPCDVVKACCEEKEESPSVLPTSSSSRFFFSPWLQEREREGRAIQAML